MRRSSQSMTLETAKSEAHDLQETSPLSLSRMMKRASFCGPLPDASGHVVGIVTAKLDAVHRVPAILQ